jgi:replicative DNA helicase|tara:strand:+ start:2257 stop:3510 length:1254 start_codon:yes stop_codon:yes gene_type:complete
MESYEYIESGIVLNLDSKESLRKFKHSSKDFAKHGDALKFINKHFDDYGSFPSTDTLVENFPTIDTTANSLNLDYAIDSFKSQVLFRNIVSSFQSNKDLLKEDPKKALSYIQSNLNDIEVVYDEDVISYDSAADGRFDAWQARSKKRKMGEGMMGIPTPFKSLNKTGVGWMPGELIAMFARPTVGKTWMCIQVAATAMMNGHKTLMISTEMPVDAISLRADVVLANMMGYKFSHSALRTGKPIDEDKYKEFLQKLNGRPLLICDHIQGESSISLESIAALIRKHNPDLVVLDGIYLVSSGDGRKAMWEQSHSLFYGMKTLALSTNTPVFVSTQATREAANMFEPPRADQVAFGDALIRSSDVAMAMCRVENEEDKRLVQYQKYRDGVLASDVSIMDWDVDRGRIEETDEDIWSNDSF